MTEKPKKSKQHISQWLFLLTWIGGQYLVFYLAFLGGLALFELLNATGITANMPSMLAVFFGGLGLGYFSGLIQQWSIRKRFGHHVAGWRMISAILTGIIMAIVIPAIQWIGWNTDLIQSGTSTYIMWVAGTFMAIFGAAGLGQAILLRKHIRHSWLFFVSTLVGGIMFGLPTVNQSSFFWAQIAQYSVTAFAILWLFGMSRPSDALLSEDEAIKRLSDSAENDLYDDHNDDHNDDYEEDQQRHHGNLWTTFLNWLRLSFTS